LHRFNATYSANKQRFLQSEAEKNRLCSRSHFYGRLLAEARDILAGRKSHVETVYYRETPDLNGDVREQVVIAGRQRPCQGATSHEPTPAQARAGFVSDRSKKPGRRGAKPAVILIDGTADATINRQFFPNLTETRLKVYKRNARIIQACDANFPLWSRVFDSGAKERELRASLTMLAAWEAFAKSHGETVLFANQTVEGKLTGYGDRLIEFPGEWAEHFNNFRGVDQYKGCGAAIIVGRTEPTISAVEEFARAIFGQADRSDGSEPLDLRAWQRYRKGPPWYEVEGGTYKPVLSHDAHGNSVQASKPVACHPDSRAHAILRQIRDYELEQAMDRLRVVARDPADEEQPEWYRRAEAPEPKTVYVLTACPLGDVEADEVLHVTQILPEIGGVRDSLMRHGWAPIDVPSLARQWGVSTNQARRRLRSRPDQSALDSAERTTIKRTLWLGRNVSEFDVQYEPGSELAGKQPNRWRPALVLNCAPLFNTLRFAAERLNERYPDADNPWPMPPRDGVFALEELVRSKEPKGGNNHEGQ
jgi:hypothetical protein